MKREEIKRLSFLISERDKYIAELDFIRKELKGKDESSWHLKVIAECEEIRHESFNSTMVRLKGGCKTLKHLLYICFNSTMVRLKDSEGTNLVARFWFQFHYGTIKSTHVEI